MFLDFVSTAQSGEDEVKDGTLQCNDAALDTVAGLKAWDVEQIRVQGGSGRCLAKQ